MKWGMVDRGEGGSGGVVVVMSGEERNDGVSCEGKR